MGHEEEIQEFVWFRMRDEGTGNIGIKEFVKSLERGSTGYEKEIHDLLT